MLSLGFEEFKKNLDDLLSVALFNDRIRWHFTEESDLSVLANGRAPHYVGAKQAVPPQLGWRIYEHSAFVTRLYGIYESYIFDLISLWLTHLTRLSPTWADLPEILCNNYRVGVGILLQRFGGPRTEHLTERAVVDSLHAGLSGDSAYALVPDAFFVDLQNLRQSELKKLCDKVALPNLLDWLSSHSHLAAHCEANSYTVESRLKDFVAYRNQAAHGATDIDEVLGITELTLLYEFVLHLADALSQFVLSNLCETAASRNACRKIAETTEYFRKVDASIWKMTEAEITNGDTVVVRGKTECFSTRVVSLQVNGADRPSINACDGDEIGVRLERTARVGTDILRLEVS